MRELPVTVTLPILWGDMDALGHVNNARYFTWFESGRGELFRRAGMTFTGAATEGPILARTDCDFLTPVEWPGQVVVGLGVTRIGTKSFTLLSEIARADDPERLAARGESVIVMVDYGSGQTVAIPDGVRGRLEGMWVESPEDEEGS